VPVQYLDVDFCVHQAHGGRGEQYSERHSHVTVCKDCHDSLEPKLDVPLIGLMRARYPHISSKYFEDLMNYQAWIKSGKLAEQ
jgi:hypothetical protein